MQTNIELNMIVAYGRNRVIGDGKTMPGWRIPTDMKNFKELRIPFPVLMGRGTWDSLDKWKPLPDSDNIITTRNADFLPEPNAENVHVCHSLEEAIRKVEELGFKKAHIIGGGQIYSQSLYTYPIHKIFATEIDGVFEGTVTFPVLDPAIWRRSVTRLKGKGPKDSHEFEFVEYSHY